MIDKNVKIVPGMRMVGTGRKYWDIGEGRVVRNVDDEGKIWFTTGFWAHEGEVRDGMDLIDQPAPSAAAKHPERKVERRLAEGWRHATPTWLCTGEDCRRTMRQAVYQGRPGTGDGACLACAEAMGVYEDSAATYSVVIDERVNFGPKEWAEVQRLVSPKCPCERMNLRDLSGDPVCYCTERPREKVRVVGTYRDRLSGETPRMWRDAQTGIATGLCMERREPTLTELACERASRRYPSTCDSEPSGA